MILVRTHLGYGSPEQDSFKAHGSPLGEENVSKTKEKLGWPADKTFYVPDEALKHFREAIDDGKKAEADWNERIDAYRKAFADEAQEFADRQAAKPKKGWDADIEPFACRQERRVDARRRRQDHERGGEASAATDGRLGRSRSFDVHQSERLRRFQSDADRKIRRPGRRQRRLELRRTQHPLRRARTRDGRDQQRPRRARRIHSVRFDVPDLLRLHASDDASRRADETARRPHLYPRQHRARRRRSDTSAGRTAREPARDSERDRDPPRRRERNHRSVARRGRIARSSGAVWCCRARTSRRSIARNTRAPMVCARARTC